MKPQKSIGFATRAIHHGYHSSENGGALNPPLHLSSTYTFEDVKHGADLFAGEREGHFYSRISNPTLSVLEQRIANLESAEAGLCTASGMGAITSVLWTLVSAGDEILVDNTLYGCTHAFMEHGLKRFGVSVRRVDMSDLFAVERAINDKTVAIYFETPANPNMRLVDIHAVCKLARSHNIKTVVDNTYSTPLITRPIELGADVVIHSATKYLGGHGDLIAGLVVGSKALMDEVRLVGIKDMTGACMSPFTAMLILRGIKTLELRMQRHSQSAYKVAKWLEQHPAIESVDYPFLDSFAQHELAKKQMSMGGGMIAFVLKPTSALSSALETGIDFMDKVTLIQRAVSLGDAETLIQHPATMTHSTYTPQEREEHGISDGLVRLSIGLESVDDILSDLAQALPSTAAVSSITRGVDTVEM